MFQNGKTYDVEIISSKSGFEIKFQKIEYVAYSNDLKFGIISLIVNPDRFFEEIEIKDSKKVEEIFKRGKTRIRLNGKELNKLVK